MRNEHSSNPDSRHVLSERLKREALADRPPFSEILHRRIMDAVEAPIADRAAEPELPAEPRGTRRTSASWAAIAAGLLIAALGIAQFGGPANDASHPDQLGSGADHPAVATTFPGERFSLDDLNHGAGVAMRLVFDQLPIDLPMDEWGLPSVD
jgi:hypothetical protein